MAARRFVFLSHNTADKPAVEEIARRLEAEGIEPWFDAWHLVPGEKWQPALEKALTEARASVIVVGPSGMGPWQDEEMRVAIDRRISDPGYRVVPLLLPGAQRLAAVPGQRHLVRRVTRTQPAESSTPAHTQHGSFAART